MIAFAIKGLHQQQQTRLIRWIT